MLDRFVTWLKKFWGNLFGLPLRLTIRQELLELFGRDYNQLETYDKHYPSYDLASLHLALDSLRKELCAESRRIGACPFWTMRDLFNRLVLEPYLMPHTPAYQRVLVDVEQEDSFVTNALYLARLKATAMPGSPAPVGTDGKAARDADKVAILMALDSYGHLFLSIAVRSRAVADRFFAEMEERRRRLSIYRGKVIDPVVTNGNVYSIGFRAIQKVREENLMLPEQVKRLIHSAILGFYNHREVLQGLGIEMKRGVLFHSPPGTGKTSISLYLAGRLPNFTVCFVSGDRLLYPREICRVARYLQPSMVVLEDIDLVAQERDGNGLATVLGELMNQIDGCEPTDQVLFVMNTNSLDRLEHAVKNRPGRVDQIIEIPLPDREQRARLIHHFGRSVKLALPDMDQVLDRTEGATPATLKEIVKRAVVSAVDRDGSQGPGEPPAVTEAEDLLQATEQVRALRDPELVPGSFGFRERATR